MGQRLGYSVLAVVGLYAISNLFSWNQKKPHNIEGTSSQVPAVRPSPRTASKNPNEITVATTNKPESIQEAEDLLVLVNQKKDITEEEISEEINAVHDQKLGDYLALKLTILMNPQTGNSDNLVNQISGSYPQFIVLHFWAGKLNNGRLVNPMKSLASRCILMMGSVGHVSLSVIKRTPNGLQNICYISFWPEGFRSYKHDIGRNGEKGKPDKKIYLFGLNTTAIVNQFESELKSIRKRKYMIACRKPVPSDIYIEGKWNMKNQSCASLVWLYMLVGNIGDPKNTGPEQTEYQLKYMFKVDNHFWDSCRLRTWVMSPYLALSLTASAKEIEDQKGGNTEIKVDDMSVEECLLAPPVVTLGIARHHNCKKKKKK